MKYPIGIQNFDYIMEDGYVIDWNKYKSKHIN